MREGLLVGVSLLFNILILFSSASQTERVAILILSLEERGIDTKNPHYTPYPSAPAAPSHWPDGAQNPPVERGTDGLEESHADGGVYL